MKKIIKNKAYSTETAKNLATYDPEIAKNDNAYYNETLYRKRTGEFFLYGKGNAGSPYSEMVYGALAPGEKITPLTFEETKRWAEKKLDSDDYEKIFGAVADDGTLQNMHIQLTQAVYRQLKDLATERNATLNMVIQKAVERYLRGAGNGEYQA